MLGARERAVWAQGAYLEIGPVWLCLALSEVDTRADYTHITFACAPDDFDTLAKRIRAVTPDWQENTSEGASVYFLDPDGHRLELHMGDLETRLAHYRAHPEKGVTLLD